MKILIKWFPVIAILLIVYSCSNISNNDVWAKNGFKSHEYMKSAHSRLSDLEEDKKKWLSLGTVIKSLGMPSNIQFMSYVYDQEDNGAPVWRPPIPPVTSRRVRWRGEGRWRSSWLWI